MNSEFEIDESGQDPNFQLIPFTSSHNQNTVDLSNFLLMEENGVMPTIQMDPDLDEAPRSQARYYYGLALQIAYFTTLSYLSEANAPSLKHVLVGDQDFFEALNESFNSTTELLKLTVELSVDEFIKEVFPNGLSVKNITQDDVYYFCYLYVLAYGARLLGGGLRGKLRRGRSRPPKL